MEKIRRTNRHHRRSRARGGDTSPRNLVEVDERHHQAFHLLFPNTHPQEVARILNEIWLDPDWQMTAVRKEPTKQKKGWDACYS